MRIAPTTSCPPATTILPVGQHDRFVEHLAAFHAAFFGWRDSIGLQDLARRLLFFAPAVIAPELERSDVAAPIAAAAEGWRRLPERSPDPRPPRAAGAR